jgi:hypothetical protein
VTASKTFTLTATNDLGTVTSTVSIVVQPEPPPTIAWFTASPMTRTGAGYVTLSWAGSNVEEFYIDGVGDVTWDFGSTQVWVSSTRTYTLRATNIDGVMTQRTITVTVN